MKKSLLFLLFLPILVHAQIQKKTIIASANINIQSQNDLENDDSKFQVTLGSRTGKFLKDSSWAFGINWSLTYRHTKVYKTSSIQSGGTWYEIGGGDGLYGSVGFFADKYFKLHHRFYLSLNNDISYFWGEFIENTTVVDENGNDMGVLVERYQYNPMRIQYNFWPALNFFFTKRHAITASIGNLNIGLSGKQPTSDNFLEHPKTIQVNLNFPSVVFGYSVAF